MREYEARVARVLTDAGARITARSTDGAGHQVVAFHFNGHDKTFHYASTADTRGCGLRNCEHRLKRMLRELPQLVITGPTVSTAPEPIPSLPTPSRITAKVPARRFGKKLRTEIAKRYMSLHSLTNLCKEFDLTDRQAVQILMSVNGTPMQMCKNELNTRRMHATRRLMQPGRSAQPLRHQPKPRLSLRNLDPKARSHLAKQAARLFFRESLTVTAVAGRLNLPRASAYILIQEA